MKRDLFRRYVWLVDVIRHAQKITFEEISNLWKDAALNTERTPLALRTFHNHREAIEYLFGLRILCDRSDHNRYYVADDGNIDSIRLKVWMLQTLSLSNYINRSDNVAGRILFDLTPDVKFGLVNTISAMKENHIVKLTYSVPTAGNRTEFEIAPYCLRHWKNGWFVMGRDMETGEMVGFELARVLNIAPLDKTFNYPEDFSPAEYFKKYYGIGTAEDSEPETVRIRLSGSTRDMVRTLPIHPTQKEIMTDHTRSMFEYNLIPTPDFISAILAMGPEAEVVTPQSLREKMADTVKSIAVLYD